MLSLVCRKVSTLSLSVLELPAGGACWSCLLEVLGGAACCAACCCWLLLLLCVAGVFALWAGPLDLIMILAVAFIYLSVSVGITPPLINRARRLSLHPTTPTPWYTTRTASLLRSWLALSTGAFRLSKHEREDEEDTTAVVAQLSLHTTLHWVPLVVTYTCGLTSLLTDCEHRVEPPSPAGSGVRTAPPAPTASAACASPCPLLAGAGGGGAVV